MQNRKIGWRLFYSFFLGDWTGFETFQRKSAGRGTWRPKWLQSLRQVPVPTEQVCTNEQRIIGNFGLELYRDARLKIKLSVKRKYGENRNLRSANLETGRERGMNHWHVLMGRLEWKILKRPGATWGQQWTRRGCRALQSRAEKQFGNRWLGCSSSFILSKVFLECQKYTIQCAACWGHGGE